MLDFLGCLLLQLSNPIQQLQKKTLDFLGCLLLQLSIVDDDRELLAGVWEAVGAFGADCGGPPQPCCWPGSGSGGRWVPLGWSAVEDRHSLAAVCAHTLSGNFELKLLACELQTSFASAYF